MVYILIAISVAVVLLVQSRKQRKLCARIESLQERVRQFEDEQSTRQAREEARLSRLRHDLKTPIATISSFSSLLKEISTDNLGPKQQRFIDHIQTGADDLLRLVEALRSEPQIPKVEETLEHGNR